MQLAKWLLSAFIEENWVILSFLTAFNSLVNVCTENTRCKRFFKWVLFFFSASCETGNNNKEKAIKEISRRKLLE